MTDTAEEKKGPAQPKKVVAAHYVVAPERDVWDDEGRKTTGQAVVFADDKKLSKLKKMGAVCLEAL